MRKILKGMAIVAGAVVGVLAIAKMLKGKIDKDQERFYLFGPEDECSECEESCCACHSCHNEECEDYLENDQDMDAEIKEYNKIEEEFRKAFAGTDFLKEIDEIRKAAAEESSRYISIPKEKEKE